MPTNKTLFKTNLSKVLKKENYDTRQKKAYAHVMRLVYHDYVQS